MRLAECRATGDGTEVLVLEVDVERPQTVVHDIRRMERIAVFVTPDDETYPELFVGVLSAGLQFSFGRPAKGARRRGIARGEIQPAGLSAVRASR